jgi:hypothetical protein
MGKEREANHKEVAHQLERIEKIKREGGDEYVIQKQVRSMESAALMKQYEVLEECKMMIPNTQQRLATAHADLSQLLVSSSFIFIPFLCQLPIPTCNALKSSHCCKYFVGFSLRVVHVAIQRASLSKLICRKRRKTLQHPRSTRKRRPSSGKCHWKILATPNERNADAKNI